MTVNFGKYMATELGRGEERIRVSCQTNRMSVCSGSIEFDVEIRISILFLQTTQSRISSIAIIHNQDMDSYIEEQNLDRHVEEQDIDNDMEEQSLAPAPFPRQVDWGNHNIWDWEAEDMETWEPASFAWQDFMNCWLDPIRAGDLHHNVFPYELQIFPESHFPMPESTMTKIGAWPFLQTLNGKMLVLERHAFLYHSLKGVREERYRGGAVLGGQPGIGTR